MPEEIELNKAAIVLREGDDVAVARRKIAGDTTLLTSGEPSVTLTTDVPAGHKIALRGIKTGDPVRRYGQIIGYATADIRPGDWVHTRNLGFGKGEGEGAEALHLDYEYSSAVPAVEYVPEALRRTFPGFLRSDGRVGNAELCRARFDGELLRRRRAGHRDRFRSLK